jgi:hypothetical protein
MRMREGRRNVDLTQEPPTADILGVFGVHDLDCDLPTVSQIGGAIY